ncbi:hypothetical protein NB701_000637 [Pantoea ananatis]|nr:hypothetical protein [Pantoea ananatis]
MFVFLPSTGISFMDERLTDTGPNGGNLTTSRIQRALES